IEFITPGGPSETVRRSLIDRLTPDARSSGIANATLAPLTLVAGAPAALTTAYACAFTTGPLDVRLAFERIRPGVQALAQAEARGAAPPTHVAAALVAAAQSVHLLSQSMATRAPAGSPGRLVYEATPRLAIASIDPASRTFAIDLRRDGVRI